MKYESCNARRIIYFIRNFWRIYRLRIVNGNASRKRDLWVCSINRSRIYVKFKFSWIIYDILSDNANTNRWLWKYTFTSDDWFFRFNLPTFEWFIIMTSRDWTNNTFFIIVYLLRTGSGSFRTSNVRGPLTLSSNIASRVLNYLFDFWRQGVPYAPCTRTPAPFSKHIRLLLLMNGQQVAPYVQCT